VILTLELACARDISEQIIFGLNGFDVFIILIVTVVLGMLLFLSKNRLLRLFQELRPSNVDVLSQHLRPAIEGSNSVVYVDARLYNKGGPGAITVWVELLQGKNSWKRKLRFHLEPEQTQDITFRISENDLSVTDKVDYRIWID
jgi:hypothetical protein